MVDADSVQYRLRQLFCLLNLCSRDKINTTLSAQVRHDGHCAE